MAEVKTQTVEREYVVPLRKGWMKVTRHKRARRSIMVIKEFVARHMKVPDRDLDKVRLDNYLNNEIWFKGSKKPPAKIKIRVKKDGDLVRVELAQMPDVLRFNKIKHENRHKKIEKKKATVKEEKPEDAEKKEEEKKDQQEKTKSVEISQEKALEKTAKAQKHTIKAKEPTTHRKALKK